MQFGFDPKARAGGVAGTGRPGPRLGVAPIWAGNSSGSSVDPSSHTNNSDPNSQHTSNTNRRSQTRNIALEGPALSSALSNNNAQTQPELANRFAERRREGQHTMMVSWGTMSSGTGPGPAATIAANVGFPTSKINSSSTPTVSTASASVAAAGAADRGANKEAIHKSPTTNKINVPPQPPSSTSRSLEGQHTRFSPGQPNSTALSGGYSRPRNMWH